MIENGRMQLTLLYHGPGGYGEVRAADGVGQYRGGAKPGAGEPKKTRSVAFAFETGEIWATDVIRLSHADYLPFLEDVYSTCFENYVAFLNSIGLAPPFRWIAGIAGANGRTFEYPLPSGVSRFGPGPRCLANRIVVEGTYASGQTARQALLPFFRKIFDACGLPRPDHLPSN